MRSATVLVSATQEAPSVETPLVSAVAICLRLSMAAAASSSLPSPAKAEVVADVLPELYSQLSLPENSVTIFRTSRSKLITLLVLR